MSDYAPWGETRPHVEVAYLIEADAEPGLLVRLLQPFARRNVIPDHVRTQRLGDRIAVEITVAAMTPCDAHLVAGNLRQVVGVRSVSRPARDPALRAA